MPGKLSVVTEETAPPVSMPKTIKAAVEVGERSLLATMRDKVAAELDAGVPPAYLAPIMRQLRELDKEIRLIDARAEQEQGGEHGPVEDEAFDASSF